MSLRFKCAVCLELKFVAVFSVLIGQSELSLALLSHSAWSQVTAVFQSAPSPRHSQQPVWPSPQHIETVRPVSKLEFGVILGRVFTGGPQWGVGSLPGQPTFAPQDLRVQSWGRGSAGARVPPHPQDLQISHTSRRTRRSFHPLLTAEHARGEPVVDQSAKLASSARAAPPRPAPPLSSGSRRQRAAAAGAPALALAPGSRPPQPGPQQTAVWSGR